MEKIRETMRRPAELGQDARERGRELAGAARERSMAAAGAARERSAAARDRSLQLGRSARENVGKLDIRWAHGPIGKAIRGFVGRFVLTPLMDYYTHRRVEGREHLNGLRGPVVIVANHASHMDTPAILRALPGNWRRRTFVAAAADYFYKSKPVATAVSVLFNTVPIERRPGLNGSNAMSHIDRLLDRGNCLLLYPEGTRNREGAVGRLRKGAAAIAARHHAPIVPIYIGGTHEAMPPGQNWPRRLRRGMQTLRHDVTIKIGRPIAPPKPEERSTVTDQIARFFEQAADATKRPERDGRWRRATKLIRRG